MPEIEIQYSTSTAFASSIIRRLTHSRFSHVDIVLPGEGLLGVSGVGKYPTYKDPGGVQIRPFNPWPYMGEAKVAHIETTDIIARNIVAWGRQQINVPFDNGALYHFLRDRGGMQALGRNWRDPEQWFCSEFCIRALEIGGLFNYQLVVTKDTISPQDSLLLINPHMTNSSILDFLT